MVLQRLNFLLRIVSVTKTIYFYSRAVHFPIVLNLSTNIFIRLIEKEKFDFLPQIYCLNWAIKQPYPHF